MLFKGISGYGYFLGLKEFDWLLEYRVWFLGLLSMYIFDDFFVLLIVYGDCSGI